MGAVVAAVVVDVVAVSVVSAVAAVAAVTLVVAVVVVAADLSREQNPEIISFFFFTRGGEKISGLAMVPSLSAFP